MRIHKVSVTIVAKVFAETEEDLMETVVNSFEAPIAHLMEVGVADIGILSGPILE